MCKMGEGEYFEVKRGVEAMLSDVAGVLQCSPWVSGKAGESEGK